MSTFCNIRAFVFPVGATGGLQGLIVALPWDFFALLQPEDHWSCIAHLSAEDMLKSAVIEEKKLRHSPWAGADNPLGPKF